MLTMLGNFSNIFTFVFPKQFEKFLNQTGHRQKFGRFLIDIRVMILSYERFAECVT